MSYWFFLSYNRDDNKDGYIKKFFADLHERVASKTATLNKAEVGFFDGEAIEVGEKWSQELEGGLQTSRCFISLFTPTYFQKKFCGKEWAVFESRQECYRATLAASAPPPALILPVLWEKKKDVEPMLPSALSAYQFNHDDFGENYAAYGLRQMMRLNKLQDDYLEFIDKFADKLVAAAKAHQLPPLAKLQSILDIIPTFPASATPPVAPIVAPSTTKANPRYVKFVFVVGPQAELQAANLRSKFDQYGASPGEWHPYLPDTTDDIEVLVNNIVADEKFVPQGSIPVDEKLIEQIEKADEGNQIVVFVVDTWTLRLPSYYQRMRKADEELPFTNCIVVVPWNEKDAETIQQSDLLQKKLKAAFVYRTLSNSPSFLSRISTVDDLRKDLSVVMQKTKMKLIERADILQQASSEAIVAKPNISAI